jgi:hypothetical protein
MCVTVKKTGKHRETKKQNKFLFILHHEVSCYPRKPHVAVQAEFVRCKETCITTFTDSTDKSHFAVNKTALSCALYLV